MYAPAVSHVSDAATPQDSPREPLSATLAGTLLMFVTFTQGNVTSASPFVVLYLPMMFLCIFVIGQGVQASGGYRPSSDGVRLRYLWLMLPVLLASLTVEVLQFNIVILGFAFGVLTLPVGPMLARLPTYAYYAAVLNAALYLGEAILHGQLGLPFDPSVLNYLGVDRDGVVTTWGLNRYGGHHTEPGSFAINFAALTVLSLMGDRKPNAFHWLAVFLLAGTLSLTAALMSVVVVVTILLANRITVKTVAVFVLALLVTAVLIVQVLPMLGLLSFDFFTERLVERGGKDGSIYLKTLLLEDFYTRDLGAAVLGNRYAECAYCSYAKSLGFGFYILFQAGFFGALLIAVLALTLTLRLGRQGIALFGVFMLMRLEFHFPQAMMFTLIVAGLPTVAERRAMAEGHRAARAPAPEGSTA